VFTVLSSWHCHWQSSPGSSDEYSTSARLLPTFGLSRLTWAADPLKLAAIYYIHRRHLFQLSSEADTHFTIPERTVQCSMKYGTTWVIDVMNVFVSFFYSCHVFTLFNVFCIIFFHVFFIIKNVVNCKVWMCKNPTKNTLRGCLAMIFIDFGLLRSPYCNISCILADVKIRVKIWQPTYDSVCEDNSWIHGKCRQRFFWSNVYKRFIFFPRFFTFLTFFYRNVYYIYGMTIGVV